MELMQKLWDLSLRFIDMFLHIDKHLDAVISNYGSATYTILFLVIFCETGLVVTPFLPGDSLLFAAGTFAARGSLDPFLLSGLILVAAVIGDAVNYAIGNWLGPRALKMNNRFFRREYLEKTQRFYEKYGGKTIIIARFIPIVRTFAPFLAGVGKMSYRHFAIYNVAGAILWVGIFVPAGYFFGNIPAVKRNFTLVIIAIIFVSVLPALIEYLRSRRLVGRGDRQSQPDT